MLMDIFDPGAAAHRHDSDIGSPDTGHAGAGRNSVHTRIFNRLGGSMTQLLADAVGAQPQHHAHRVECKKPVGVGAKYPGLGFLEARVIRPPVLFVLKEGVFQNRYEQFSFSLALLPARGDIIGIDDEGFIQ